ncbi:MAG: biotin-dependent carboxyltransferase family protein [Phycisphaerales bacterium JB060]
MSLRVVEVGGVATVQDLGRPGHAHHGVPPGGAADTLSLRVMNRAVGNHDNAAVIELAMGSIELEADERCVVVASGGEHAFEAINLASGERLVLGPGKGVCRTYIAVAGGIDVPMVLGSRSTLRSAGCGGYEGRQLEAGDVLPVGGDAGRAADVPAHVRAMVEFAVRRRVLRVVTDGAEAELPAGLLRASANSDRVGVRLERVGGGRAIDSGPSRGVLHGTIQAPSSGELVVLGSDGPTTGGYATVGTVIAADLPALGQLLPGQWVRLEVIDRQLASGLLALQHSTLDLATSPVE